MRKIFIVIFALMSLGFPIYTFKYMVEPFGVEMLSMMMDAGIIKILFFVSLISMVCLLILALSSPKRMVVTLDSLFVFGGDPMSDKNIIRKVIEGFKCEMIPEKKIRLVYLLQQYSMNATRLCLREIICSIPLGALISEDQIDNLMSGSRPPSFKELTDLFIDDGLLPKLLK